MIFLLMSVYIYKDLTMNYVLKYTSSFQYFYCIYKRIDIHPDMFFETNLIFCLLN